ncbi:MSHA biogenesis protein MshF [Vibrio hepatarius]|uniref:MSHA biogenesis protein MshF n=1 Tax=Vibrio hepatarius TaxID=171383 RepID=UPI00158C99D8|nr:MSHA biogenesis protein MshF [Vibrio hepatarius]
MPSKGDLFSNVERSRFVIWLLVVVIVLLSFIIAWQRVEEEARDSAYLVASKRIIERASYYKEQWLLAKQPNRLTIESRQLQFSDNGWLMPLTFDGKVSCEFWLNTLYPTARILESRPIEIVNNSSGDHYQCDYDYGQNRHIVIELINKQFSTRVVFVAL